METIESACVTSEIESLGAVTPCTPLGTPLQSNTPERKKSESTSIIEDLKITAKKEKFYYKHFKEFTDNTSLHGFSYIGQDRPLLEKTWWVVMIVLSTVICCHLIIKQWNKWEESPVIISFADTSTPIWQIPFPAVTICPETKSRATVYNYAEMYSRYACECHNITGEELTTFEDVLIVCDDVLNSEGRKIINASSVKFLRKIAPLSHELIFSSRILHTVAVFKPTVTDDGFCYTFNMLSEKEMFNMDTLHKDYSYVKNKKKSKGWKLEDGYPSNLSMDTYPARARGVGIKAALTVVLLANSSEWDIECNGQIQSFKILLHSPANMPRLSGQYFRLPLSQEAMVVVKPSMMVTSEGLRDYDPHRRQCFFESERKLKYFKVYTQNNCEIECLSNLTMVLCGCVEFTMPRDPTMPICGSGSYGCTNEAANYLMTRDIRRDLSDENKVQKWHDWYKRIREDDINQVVGKCDCLPACTSINYDVQISQTEYKWLSLGLRGIHDAKFIVVFKEPHFIPSRRSEVYGSTDFLANCGGLLGLCLGFSVLSLLEIIYFLTLRACCNVKRSYSKWRQSHSNIDIYVIKE